MLSATTQWPNCYIPLIRLPVGITILIVQLYYYVYRVLCMQTFAAHVYCI